MQTSEAYFATQNAVPAAPRAKISAHSFVVVGTADTTSVLPRFI
jgi:hypothetical protein